MTEHKTGGGIVITVDPARSLLVYEYTWNGGKKQAKIDFATPEAIEDLKKIKVGDNVSAEYDMEPDFSKKLTKVSLKGAKTGGGGGGSFRGGSPKSPEERRSIELQSTYRVTADIFIACLQKSNAPVAMDFSKMVETVWTETVKVADKIREKSKEGGS